MGERLVARDAGPSSSSRLQLVSRLYVIGQIILSTPSADPQPAGEGQRTALGRARSATSLHRLSGRTIERAAAWLAVER
jgi:hypothetical protein